MAEMRDFAWLCSSLIVCYVQWLQNLQYQHCLMEIVPILSIFLLLLPSISFL